MKQYKLVIYPINDDYEIVDSSDDVVFEGSGFLQHPKDICDRHGFYMHKDDLDLLDQGSYPFDHIYEFTIYKIQKPKELISALEELKKELNK